jgi:hypothetical protein
MTIPGDSQKQFLMPSSSLSILPDSQCLLIQFQTISPFPGHNIGCCIVSFYIFPMSPGITKSGNHTDSCDKLTIRHTHVAEVLDRWLSPEYRYFKCLGADGGTYILRQDVQGDRWELTFYQHGKLDPDRVRPGG